MVLGPAKWERVEEPVKTETLSQARWELGTSREQEPRNLTDVTYDIKQLTPLYLKARNQNPSQEDVITEQWTESDEHAFWKTLSSTNEIIYHNLDSKAKTA